MEKINCEVTGPFTICCIALFMGIMCFLAFKLNFVIGVVYTISYVFIIFISESKFSWVVMMMVGVLGYTFVWCYFTQNLPKEETIRAQLVSKKPGAYYGTCSYKGKLVTVCGLGDEVELGEYVYISGKFTKNPKYEYGTVGEIRCNKTEVDKTRCLLNIFSIRESIYDKLMESIGEKRAGIIMSLCYGDTRYIDSQYGEELNDLGIVHIISVSGLHISILFSVLEFIPSVIIQCLIGFLYVLLTGSKAATLRAFIMIVVARVGRKLYKKYDSINALSLSAIIILCIKPWYAFNMGFLLSYSSVLGIIIFYRFLRRKLYMLPSKVNESVSLSLASMSITFMLLSIMNKTINVGFLISNMVLVPMYSMLTLLGLLFMVVFKIPVLNDIISCIIIGVFAFTDKVKNLFHEVFFLEFCFSYGEIVMILFMVCIYLKCRGNGRKIFKAAGVCLCFMGIYRIL